jgi:hypothetical protein
MVDILKAVSWLEDDGREAATATPSISMPVSVNSWKLDDVYRDIVRGDEESSTEQSTRIYNNEGASE